MTPAKTQHNLTLHFALIEAFFWMQFAVLGGFASIYLLAKGFSNTQIGMVIASAGAISALLQPIVATYADRPSSPSIKRILLVAGSLLLLAGALLIFLDRYMPATALLYGGCITLLHLQNPLLNSLGMETLNQGGHLNFGIARGIGSLAYAVIAYALGILVAARGSDVIPVSIVAVFACFLAVLSCFPFCKVPKDAADARAAAQSPAAFLRRYPRFGIVLIGSILIYINHMMVNSFTYQIVESKGGSSAETGIVMALAAVLELPTMFLFGAMVRRVRCDIWFRISGAFFFLKTLGMLLAPSIPLLYASQVFQMFGFALITVSSVYYVNAIMEPQDAIKGQAYMTITNTLGAVIGSLLAGRLIDQSGITVMLIWACAIAFAGTGIMLVATEATK